MITSWHAEWHARLRCEAPRRFLEGVALRDRCLAGVGRVADRRIGCGLTDHDASGAGALTTAAAIGNASAAATTLSGKGVILGANLDMLGKRDASLYGRLTLDEIKAKIQTRADQLQCQVEVFQSNSEGELID